MRNEQVQAVPQVYCWCWLYNLDVNIDLHGEMPRVRRNEFPSVIFHNVITQIDWVRPRLCQS